jgi:hypothetical protein
MLESSFITTFKKFHHRNVDILWQLMNNAILLYHYETEYTKHEYEWTMVQYTIVSFMRNS